MAQTKVKLISDGVIVQSNLHASHGITTADIGEGSNLYYTDARARAAVSVSGNALSYNSSTGVITSNFEENPVFTTGVTVANDSGHFTLFRTDGVTQLGKLYDDSGFTIEGKANNNLILRTKANSLGEGIKFQDTSSNNLMFIDGTNGRVGIGTTSPNEKLHVAGNIHAYDTSADRTLFASSAAGTTTIAIRSNGITHFNGGNVGINTTSPTNLLNIKGNGNSKGLDIHHSNGNIVAQLIHGGSGDEGQLKLYDSNSETVRISGENNIDSFINSGNVGIGHASPTSKLSIVADGGLNTYAGVIGIENTDGDPWACISLTDDIDTASAASNYYLIGRGISYADRQMSLHVPTASDYGSGAQPKIIFASTGADTLFSVEASTGTTYHKGSVGIGATSPSQKLDVSGNIYASGRTQSGNTLIGTKTISSTNFATLGSNSSGVGIAIARDHAPSSYPDIIINSSGNVGIGTNSPSVKLEVSGHVQVSQKIDVSSYVHLGQTVSGAMAILAHNARVDTSTANRITVTNSSWPVSFIKMYYDQGISFHTTSTTQTAGTVVLDGTGANSLERMRVTDNGITFNGDTAAANALDDYEEGTFTPTVGDGTYTYSYRRGHYQKVGNTVYIHIGFKINSASSVGTATASISGLPFTGMSWGSYQEPMEKVVGGLFVTSNLSFHLAFFVGNSSSTLYARTTASNNDAAVASNQLWQNGTFIKLQLQYTVS